MNIDGRTPLNNLGAGLKIHGSKVEFHELLCLETGGNLESYYITTLIAPLHI